jgi:hypothetical protein
MQPKKLLSAEFLFAAIGAGLAMSVVQAPSARAEDRPPSACIDLQRMSTTRAVDNRTIVVTLRGGGYRKISLATTCFGLKIQDGFAYETSISKLCPGDIITVLGGGGDRCGIAEITPLNASEAKSLLAKR